MKYPQSVPMPRDVEDWLEGELEARGIDAVVYTRYILSLMQQDTLDFELGDIWSNHASAKSVWNRHERKQLDGWQTWDQEALKRLAVMRCLMSATGQKYEIDSLVDELCAKLKDIQSSAQIQEPTFLQPYEIPTEFNKSFPPLQGKFKDRGIVGESCATSAWTRGILRASLDTTDTALPYDDAIKAQEFPMIHTGPRGMFDGYIEMITEKAPMQEDLSFYNNHITDHCFGTTKRIDSPWNPIDNADKLDTFKPNQAFFYDNNKLFSSADFVKSQIKPVTPPTFPVWSLGGSTNTLPNHKPDGSCFKEVARKIIAEEKPLDNAELPDSLAEEEDLLTSARTHFRPIRCDESAVQPPVYADGTTFAISTELKPLQFERSESGTLFLETGKYMEFKTESESESGAEEFVPKFKVRQSNEKFCQTEDLASMAETCEQLVPASSESSESDPDEFYFPGDDILALHLNVEEMPAEEEVEQIVSGRLDVRWKILPKTPIVDEHDMEPNWESNNEALVNQLVNEEPAWQNTYCDLSQDDDCMEGVIAETETGNAVCWPQLTDSIWNPKTQNCDTCKGPNDSDGTGNFMTKNEWQEIWGQPICDGCKVDAAADGQIQTLDATNGVKSKKSVNWSQFGPVGVKLPQKDGPDSFWKWPNLGAALTSYLEESRLRAFEMLNNWSPVDISTDFDAVKKPNESDLRDLWGPDDKCKMTEYREIWSPLVDLQTENVTPSQRPRTYSMLREELSEDGDQLLSDLSYLHMNQLNADAAESFEQTGAPNQFVNIFATWKLVIDDKDLGLLEQPYNSDTAQKERKRRHSSSQKMCELYKKGECRRSHCRFIHGDDATNSPFLTSFAPNVFRGGHELQRAFTL